MISRVYLNLEKKKLYAGNQALADGNLSFMWVKGQVQCFSMQVVINKCFLL